MRLDMTDKGPSEQLIRVSVDTDEGGGIEVLDQSTYDHLRKFCDYKRETCLAFSEYAGIWVNAIVALREGVTVSNFEDKYRESTTKTGKTYDPDRMVKVVDYKTKMESKNEFFPYPILMFRDGELIQVDGARRLMAQALSKTINHSMVIVVIRRRDIKNILEPEFVQKVNQLHVTQKWFNNYQEIIELGLVGKRSYSGRFPSILDLSLLKDKTVAEFGCSNGMALFEAYYRGAYRVVGFEHVPQNVEIINMMGKRFSIPVEAHRIDFNDPDWLDQVKRILPEWDYSVFLSTYRTLELKDRDGLVRGMWEGSKEGMIFEGHQQAVDTDQFYRDVFSTKAALTDYEVVQLPKGIIERPYDAGYRPKYLLKRIPS